MNQEFPTFNEVLTIHHALITEFGGAFGIRDESLLISALTRPQVGYYDSVTQKAAAFMESLANNHPFVDGNKRAAFFATDTFLRMSGFFIDCDNEQAHQHLMGLFDSSRFKFKELEKWLENNVKPLA